MIATKIRIIGKYGNYRMGAIMNPPATLRNHLVRVLKVAELVGAEKPAATPSRIEKPPVSMANPPRSRPRNRK